MTTTTPSPPDTLPNRASSDYERIFELAQFVPVLTTPPMTFEQFVEMGTLFPEFRLEREPNGQITIMPPVFFGSGARESEANGLVWQWNRQTQLGRVLSASTGVNLPDGSTKQANTFWVSNEKLKPFNAARLDASYLPVAPDFVIEIRSKTDQLDTLKSKMTNAWIANGVRLAWLIDPYEEKAWVYRMDGSVEIIKGFDGKKLSGEDVMPGFELALDEFKLPAEA
jgi:Uma2 family endonuclease